MHSGTNLTMKRLPHLIIIDGDLNISEVIRAATKDLDLQWTIESYPNIDVAMHLLDGTLVPMHNADIMLVDSTIPNMAAFDFLFCAKKHPQYKEVPIIVVSNDENNNGRDISYHFNANAYCQMPCTSEEVKTFVKALHTFWMDKYPISQRF